MEWTYSMYEAQWRHKNKENLQDKNSSSPQSFSSKPHYFHICLSYKTKTDMDIFFFLYTNTDASFSTSQGLWENEQRAGLRNMFLPWVVHWNTIEGTGSTDGELLETQIKDPKVVDMTQPILTTKWIHLTSMESIQTLYLIFKFVLFSTVVLRHWIYLFHLKIKELIH